MIDIALVVDDYAVCRSGAFGGEVTESHVTGDQARIALKRVTEPTAARRPDAEDISRLQSIGMLGRQSALLLVASAHVRRGRGLLAPKQSERRDLDAVAGHL